jgi:hypothetical protein
MLQRRYNFTGTIQDVYQGGRLLARRLLHIRAARMERRIDLGVHSRLADWVSYLIY